MKKYAYFMSYNFHDKSRSGGYGCLQINLDKKITDFEQIIEVAREIKKDLMKGNESFKNPNVVVLNYILLGRR